MQCSKGDFMDSSIAIVPGVVNSDGSLELAEKLCLPAGPVQVTVVPMPDLPKDDPFWHRMQSIWTGQKARGHVPRSVEVVEAEKQSARAEWDERMQRLERIQAEAKQARKKGSPQT
jgi:hypothetical protein